MQSVVAEEFGNHQNTCVIHSYILTTSAVVYLCVLIG